MSEEVRYPPARGDGRHVTTMGFCQHLLRAATGRLAWRPGLDDAGFAEWRQRVRDKLALLEIHHYPRYTDPAARIHDDDEIPEGLTMEEYFTYANVDVPNHNFKHAVAVPWLVRTPNGNTT